MYRTEPAAATLPLDLDGLGLQPDLARRPEPVGAGLAGGIVAVRLADVGVVVGAGGGPVLVPRAGGRVADGELVVWCQVTAVTRAVLGRDQSLGAEGFLPDHVRLGVLEEHLGQGIIEQVIAEREQVLRRRAAREQADHTDKPDLADEAGPVSEPDPGLRQESTGVAGIAEAGKVRGRRLRVMTLALTARLVLAMTLMPQASYVESLAQLVGLLPRLPWVRSWRVPSSTVITKWRRALGVEAMKTIFDRVAGHIVAATDPDALWHGMRVAAIDGCQVRLPDTAENRDAFGSSGTSDDGAGSPFPLARSVLATDRAGRAVLAAELDASWVGEQSLAGRLVANHPHLFTNECVFVVDRNFLSHAFVLAAHQGGRGAHLVARAKSTVKLPVVQRFGDGDYLSYLRSPDGRSRLTVRVVEYDVTRADGTPRSGRRDALLRPAPLVMPCSGWVDDQDVLPV